jgi:hypothetical protein
MCTTMSGLNGVQVEISVGINDRQLELGEVLGGKNPDDESTKWSAMSPRSSVSKSFFCGESRSSVVILE